MGLNPGLGTSTLPEHGEKKKQKTKKKLEFPSWLSGNEPNIHEDACLIPGLDQWVKDPAVSCGAGHRRGLDLALL